MVNDSIQFVDHWIEGLSSLLSVCWLEGSLSSCIFIAQLTVGQLVSMWTRRSKDGSQSLYVTNLISGCHPLRSKSVGSLHIRGNYMRHSYQESGIIGSLLEAACQREQSKTYINGIYKKLGNILPLALNTRVWGQVPAITSEQSMRSTWQTRK